ncbi:M42 family metallopeptidase [Ruminococcus sp.]|uniref:M42 family metallopeptidase n=1 Tax=Ruminococcus sp. TaxID=41978 RepID=UPI002CBBC2E3|nr:M42 family metallopeptidase [Ruminococcus sp.]HNZ98589.1 M42 family metallopeptidase [Ruminococcus sp.]HOH88136.1 M42 family metallopeptidase [Ruminococcus sp.]
MKELLKELCLIDGISGDEGAVRDYIISKVKDYCQYSVDDLGNLICFRKGRKSPKKKLMICVHMDEVGFMVTYIRSDGTLRFDCVGGIDPSVIIGRQVRVGKDRISGVIGSTAVHNLSREQREKAPSVDSLYIDIGAASKEEAEKHVSLGDCVYYDSEFTDLGEHCVKSKAIDDRAGCAIMIKLMQEKPDYDTYFVFNVQEEIGLRGSAVSSFSVAPDFAIVLEATTAADIDGVTGEKRVCELGRGPVVSFMDRRTIYDKELYKLAFDLATCQTKTMIAGGNDAGAIHISGKGVRTISVSVPCRYLHSPSSVIDMSDLISSFKLVKNLSKRIPLL